MFSGFFLQTGLFLLVSCKSIFLYGSFCKKVCFCRFLLAKETCFLMSLFANEPIFVDLFVQKRPMFWQEGIYTNRLVRKKRHEKEVSFAKFAKRDLQNRRLSKSALCFGKILWSKRHDHYTHTCTRTICLSLSLTRTHIHGVD